MATSPVSSSVALLNKINGKQKRKKNGENKCHKNLANASLKILDSQMMPPPFLLPILYWEHLYNSTKYKIKFDLTLQCHII